MITFSEKKSWSCPSCGDGYAFVALPIPTWSVSSPPATNVVSKLKRFRSDDDFIATSKSTAFAGDRTCMNNQWNMEMLWDSGKFSNSKYPVGPWDENKWLNLYYPGYTTTTPDGVYGFSVAQRNIRRRYVRFVGSFHMASNGMAIAEPLTPSSVTMYLGYKLGPASQDHYRYTWLISGSHALCLVSWYTLVCLKGSDVPTTASARFGVYCYGTKPGVAATTFCFDGVSTFNNVGLWIPDASLPRIPSVSDVKDWIANGVSDPFGLLPKASIFTNQLGSNVPSGYSASYVSNPVDFSLCDPALVLSSNASKYDRKYLFVPNNEYEWADLCDTAIDNCRFIDINSLAYVREFVGYVRSIVTFVTTKKITLPKDAGSAWLSSRYGLRLTLNDTKSIYESAHRAMQSERRAFSVAHSRKTETMPCTAKSVLSYTRESFYKVYYNRKNDPALKAIRTLMDWDLWPTLQNDWDLIPFSFVVDWFVDAEGVLEDLDNSIYQAYLSILSVLYTEKHIYVHDPTLFNAGPWKCMSCEHVYYHRRQSPFLHYAPLRLERGHSSNINIVDAVSLVIQRMIK